MNERKKYRNFENGCLIYFAIQKLKWVGVEWSLYLKGLNIPSLVSCFVISLFLVQIPWDPCHFIHFFFIKCIGGLNNTRLYLDLVQLVLKELERENMWDKGKKWMIIVLKKAKRVKQKCSENIWALIRIGVWGFTSNILVIQEWRRHSLVIYYRLLILLDIGVWAYLIY